MDYFFVIFFSQNSKFNSFHSNTYSGSKTQYFRRYFDFFDNKGKKSKLILTFDSLNI